MALNGTLDAEARREALSAELLQESALRLNDSARKFDVHPMTIRRDFDALVTQGLARRVRGGVIALQGDDFEHRHHMNAESKRVIGQKLLTLVSPGMVIALDSSTTIHVFAEMLEELHGLTTVTNGLRTFQTLHARAGVQSFLTGGQQEDLNESLVGSLAEGAIQHFVIDTTFISTMSLDTNYGTSEITMQQVDFKRALTRVSGRVVLAVDSSKFETQARFRSLGLSDHDLLVTELDPRDSRLDPYRDHVSQIL